MICKLFIWLPWVTRISSAAHPTAILQSLHPYPISITNLAINHNSSIHPPQSPSQPSPSHIISWSQPLRGWKKINFDAAFIRDCYQVSLCAIARNASSVLLDGLNQFDHALEAEAHTALLALSLAWKFPQSQFLFELDCQSLIRCINNQASLIP